MSRKQAIVTAAVVAAAVAVVLLAVDETGLMVSALTVLLTLGALSVLVLRVQYAVLREVRRSSTATKRADEKSNRELAKVSSRQHKIEETLAIMRKDVKSTNTKNEARIAKSAGDVDRIRALRVRLEEAERRILAGTETSRLSMEDSAKKLISQGPRETRDVVRQVEALFQLFAGEATDQRAPMPPTGNYALDAPAMLHLLHLIRSKRPQRILELGSGTSTIWIAYLCRELGIELVSLDHLEGYAQQTKAALRRHGLEDVVDLRVAPLEPVQIDGQTFEWYAQGASSDLSGIDLLIVDGPPKSTGPRARFPAVPALRDKLSDQATIVLDDMHRSGEVEILESWRSEFAELVQEDEGLSRLGVLRRGILA
ncbi:O-methyltransferase [Nesterenkonia sandarakina]|uniref:Putative O-methyltransferase YrrM n=1 Tax=Nesterenkonia sandarakina TaxID=272918 RepID=A0A7Z0J3Y0_9MICC|nr:class I SAM-dependent methyltransferase [Nesterenkonia sandarakina]NYJ17872.1 putative O-methyltransferase YrrM [Nesterenkonia sandarakina]